MRKRAMKENRVDDAKPEVIRRRFAVYEAETMPVLEFYKGHTVTEVDAMRSPAAVLCEILEAIVPIQESHYRELATQG
jgi:adenylate kinase